MITWRLHHYAYAKGNQMKSALAKVNFLKFKCLTFTSLVSSKHCLLVCICLICSLCWRKRNGQEVNTTNPLPFPLGNRSVVTLRSITELCHWLLGFKVQKAKSHLWSAVDKRVVGHWQWISLAAKKCWISNSWVLLWGREGSILDGCALLP